MQARNPVFCKSCLELPKDDIARQFSRDFLALIEEDSDNDNDNDGSNSSNDENSKNVKNSEDGDESKNDKGGASNNDQISTTAPES